MRADAPQQDENAGRFPHHPRYGEHRRPNARRDAGGAGEHLLPRVNGGPRTGPPAGQQSERPPGWQGLLPSFLSRAGRPWTAQVDHCEYPQGDRRGDAGMHRGGVAAIRSDSREHSPGIVPQDGRDGEAPRKHVPGHQHRAGERDGYHVRTTGGGRLGGHRRGRHQSPSGTCLSTQAPALAGTAYL